MKLDKQETKELTNAIVEMARNSIVDEQPEACVAVFLYCTKCEDFHLQVYGIRELVTENLDMMSFLKFMLTKGSEPDKLFLSSCKKMGASLANEGKIVLSVSMIGSGGTLTLIDPDKSLEDMEVNELASKVASGEIGEDEVDITATLFVSTESKGDIYYQIQYDVEFVSDNDLFFNNRDENDSRTLGNLFDIHDALLNSANMITSVKMSMLDEEERMPENLGDNEAKFRAILERIRNSFTIDSVG